MPDPKDDEQDLPAANDHDDDERGGVTEESGAGYGNNAEEDETGSPGPADSDR